MALLLGMVLAASATGCGDDEQPVPRETGTPLTMTAQPTPVNAGSCFLRAGVKKITRAAALDLAPGTALAPDASGRTGVGKATASYRAARDYVYVVGRLEQQIAPATVVSAPQTYEFVGVARAPTARAVKRAGDCLDGLIGDD